MSETFCGVCRHPVPGHEPNCPAETGEAVRGMINIEQVQSSALQQSMQGGLSQMVGFEALVLSKLSQIEDNQDRILEILIGAQPVIDILTKVKAIGSIQKP